MQLSSSSNNSSTPEDRLQAVSVALLEAQRYQGGWDWIGEEGLEHLDKKRANKFLFGCILDYQMDSDIIWKRCRAFLEIALNDPDDLWNVVAETPLSNWLERMREFEYEGKRGLHR